MLGFATETKAASRDLDSSRQCLLVLTDNWVSTNALLRCFRRDEPSAGWKQEGTAIPVVLGRNGLGRGLGLVEVSFNRGAPKKKEGDGKAPAGIFQLGYAFGYSSMSAQLWINLPYMELSDQIEGIDDPKSRYYNRLVNRLGVEAIDWRTSEKMRRSDSLYKWGVVVNQNVAAVPGAGSCIFLHIWESAATTTSGCTAMSEQNMERLLKWLDDSQNPILIQMPRESYRSIRAEYGLPPTS